MAKKLKRYDFDERGGGAASKYDWASWTDGDPWEIRKGEDYDVDTENMRVNLHAKAKQKGLKVQTRIVPRADDPEHGEWEGLVFRFFAPPAREQAHTR
jgi:hypothetical protein